MAGGVITKREVQWNQYAPELTSENYKPYSNSYLNLDFNEDGIYCTILADGKTYSTAVVGKKYFTYIENHKYYFREEIYCSNDYIYEIVIANIWKSRQKTCYANQWTVHHGIVTSTANISNIWIGYCVSNMEKDDFYKIRNVILIDLTKMYGEGNEPNTVNEFITQCAFNGIDLNKPQSYTTGIAKTWYTQTIPDIMELRRRIILDTPHIVTSASSTFQNFRTNMSAPLKEFKVNFSYIREGSGTPSPDNIRPFIGWDKITLTRSGKNMFSLMPFTGYLQDDNWEALTNIAPVIDTEAKTISITGKQSGMSVLFRKTPLKPGSYTVSYNMSGEGTTATSQKRIIAKCFDSSDNIIDGSNLTIPGMTWNQYYQGFYVNNSGNIFTIPDAVSYFWIAIGAVNEGYNLPIVFSNIQVERDIQSSDYEPAVKIDSLVDWGDEHGTLYGGYIDLIKGELTATYTKIKVPLSSFNKYEREERIGYVLVDYNLGVEILRNSNQRSNIAPYQWEVWNLGSVTHFYSYSNSPSSYYVQLSLPVGSNEDIDFECVAELKTPITYKIDPVNIKTLIGENNIWSTANGNIELKYWKH